MDTFLGGAIILLVYFLMDKSENFILGSYRKYLILFVAFNLLLYSVTIFFLSKLTSVWLSITMSSTLIYILVRKRHRKYK